MKNASNKQTGFTVVEVMAAVVISVLFITAIASLGSVIYNISANNKHFTKANDLAYSNLRIYANNSAPDWFPCDDSTDAGSPRIMYNKHIANKADYDSDARAQQGLVPLMPLPINQRVTARAPYGCKNGMPILVESEVRYNGDSTNWWNTSERAVHATYVSQ